MPIDMTGPIGSAASLTGPRARPGHGASGADFGEALGALVSGVERASDQANNAVVDMLDKNGEVHDAMIALTRAEVALQLTVQVRNKLVQAYQDVMRMPI
jgi:flagellar hook-basal body complex protein FliE